MIFNRRKRLIEKRDVPGLLSAQLPSNCVREQRRGERSQVCPENLAWKTAAAHLSTCSSRAHHSSDTTTILSREGGREGAEGNHQGQELYRGEGRKEMPAESPPQEDCKRAV